MQEHQFLCMQGKVVFLAPTKPLVHQQMEACQQFMGSSKVVFSHSLLLAARSPNDMFNVEATPRLHGKNVLDRGDGLMVQENSVVLDGGVHKDSRITLWNSAHKRIFFATPQTLKNDIFKGP
jgi:ERCC4-related helicase